MSKTAETFLRPALEDWRQKGLERQWRWVQGSQGTALMVDGKRVLNFCSNNYLGLASDNRLVEAAAASLRQEGFGAGASRLVCGNMSAFKRLEDFLASWKNTEGCLIFNTGYMANVGILSSLMGRDDAVFCDRLNHASIIDGILLSQAKLYRYPHADMDALHKLLKEETGHKKRLIVTESVFSMDGDIAPLTRLVELAQKYDCLTMVDEAHALGVLGAGGKGAVEHFGLEGKIDIQMGTLSKAVGALGAYACGSSSLIRFLMNKARSFVYTTALPPSVAAAALAGLEIIANDSERRKRLWENTRFVKEQLQACGFDTGKSETPIIPVLVGESAQAMEFSQRLFEEGIFVSAIRPPTVPVHTARLRLTVTATHSLKDLKFLVEKMRGIGRKLKVV